MEVMAERNKESSRASFDDPFRFNEELTTRSFPGANQSCTFILKDVRLFRAEEATGKPEVLLNSSLPRTEWYDLVELLQSPENPQELWLSVGGKELYHSGDGGASFEKIMSVTAVADISFVPSRRAECKFVVHILGRIDGGGQGTFVSWNQGKSWCPFDLMDYLPLS